RGGPPGEGGRPASPGAARPAASGTPEYARITGCRGRGAGAARHPGRRGARRGGAGRTAGTAAGNVPRAAPTSRGRGRGKPTTATAPRRRRETSRPVAGYGGPHGSGRSVLRPARRRPRSTAGGGIPAPRRRGAPGGGP